jgi:single-stranded DNA-specific DHH superfamily exonuclease
MHGLKEKEIDKIKEELFSCQKPVFLFHDDADGLSSFLLLYRFIKEGYGMVVKSRPSVDEKFAEKVISYEADKIFVLDIAILKQEFVDLVKLPVIWIDHHAPTNLDKVTYFNPRLHKSDIVYPVTNVCYDITQEDIWIAMAGCVGDWHLPYFKKEFCEKYPDLLDENITDPSKALFETKIGKLAKIMNFILKGSTKEAMQCVKIFTRIQSPYEILNQETPQGKFIYQRFEKINKSYELILGDIKKHVKEDERFLIYTYHDNKMSFTGELSNEMLYLHPNKIIVIGREKSGEMRMSLRSKGVHLPSAINGALIGIEGYGGGHEYACGACVKKEQFDSFIEKLRKEIEK